MEKSTIPVVRREMQGFALKIASIYAAMGAGWIFFSDELAAMIVRNPETLLTVSLFKGWVYVFLTALLLYHLIRRGVRKLESSRNELLLAKDSWERTFDAVPDLIAIIDADYRIVMANAAMAAKLGRTREACVGIRCHEVVHGATDPPAYCPHRQLLMDGTQHVVSVHEEILGGDYLVSDSPLFDPDNHFVGSVHVARDITETKQSMESLRKSETLFRNLFENHAAIKLMIDPDSGNIIDANHAAEIFYGWSKEQLKQMKIFDINKLSAEEVRQEMEKARSKEHVYFEFQHLLADGSIRDVAVFSSKIVADEKELLHSIVHDVTDRKYAEKELLQTKANLAALIGSTHDFIWSVDIDSRLMAFNKALGDEVFKNFGQVLCIGASPEQLLPVEMADNWQSLYRRAIDDGSFRSRLLLVDGRILEVSFNRIVQGDTVTGVAVFGKDITDLVHKEQEIKQLNRLYRVLGRVSQTVVGAASTETFLEESCRVIVEEGDFLLSWIGFMEESTHHVVPKALCGEACEYVRDISIYADDRPEGRGPTGTCIREGRSIIQNDFMNSPLTPLWRERAAAFGIRSSAAFPIRLAGRVSGALMIYSGQENFFGAEDVKLLEKVADVIGFALDNLEEERLRRLAERTLRESDERFRQLAENINQVIWMADRDITEMLYVSPAFEVIWGIPCDRLYADPKLWIQRIHPEDLEMVISGVAAREAEGHRLEYRIVRSDGEIRWIIDRGFPVRDESGKIYRFAGIAEDITERKRAEEALKRSEALFSTVFRASPVGITISNLENGRFLDVNDAYLDLIGLTREQTIGHSFAELNLQMHSGEGDRITGMFEQQTLHGQEIQLRSSTGDIYDILLSAEIFELDGEKYLLSLIHDITRIKRIEEELRESEERFRNLFEQTREAILIMDEGRFVDANAAALRMLRLKDIKQFTAITPADISPPYQPDGLLSADKASEMIRISLDQGAHQFEWEHVRADGEHFIAEVLVTVIQHKDRRLLNIVWRDITENKRLEKTLNDYRQHLEEMVAQRTLELKTVNDEQLAIFDSAPVGIVLLRDRRIVRCNRKLEEIFGYAPGELIGESVRAWYPDEATYEEMGREVYPLVWRGETFYREMVMVRKDGTQFWARMTETAVDANDSAKGLMGIIVDITHERNAHQVLVEAKEQAEAATRAKSAFLANMSHEIRTPLNAIVGFAHLLKRDPLTSGQINRLDKMTRAARHLLQIINDILDLSKIEAGKVSLEMNDFEPARVIDHVCSIFSDKMASKNLELIVHIDRVPDVLRGDDMRLGQILVNLLGNAEKFTEKGTISLTVGVVEQRADSAMMRIEVRDTGVGMTPEQMDRVFSAFEQADGSTTRRFGGTGLGLSITKRLVEMMNGSIGVESKPDHGTLFWMEIPFELAGRKSLASAVLSDAITNKFGQIEPMSAWMDADKIILELEKRRGSHILLVEDNPINQEVASQLLESMGMQVSVAGNGQIAVEMTRLSFFDAILMDVQMPVMDGLQATMAIRSLPGWESIPILAMTANAFEEDGALCLSAGMNDHLAKPVEPEKLNKVLVKWLKERHESEAAKVSGRSLAEPAPDSGENLLSLLQSVEELDVSRGLLSLAGNVPTYIRLLNLFVETHGNDAILLSKQMESADWGAVCQTAHALKGVAATLGAKGVQQSALELEKAVKQAAGPNELRKCVDAVASRLDPVVSSLRRILPESGRQKKVENIDWEQVDQVLAKMEPLLAAHDTTATELFENWSDVFASAFPESAATLERQIRDFDYADALETTKHIRQNRLSKTAEILVP